MVALKGRSAAGVEASCTAFGRGGRTRRERDAAVGSDMTGWAICQGLQWLMVAAAARVTC
ncbi:hypothetical protein SESBI_31630 [Sesbania bispinosa]|nr:hypothetical protein SESBI_31630 [Sesbania bispinosa]